jgi:hypothetical protein
MNNNPQNIILAGGAPSLSKSLGLDQPWHVTLAAASPSLSNSLGLGKPWYVVRAGLLITLAGLLGVLGVVIACPSVVDLTLAVMR